VFCTLKPQALIGGDTVTRVSAGTSVFGRGKRRFLFSRVSRPALGNSQPRTHWLPKELLPEINQK